MTLYSKGSQQSFLNPDLPCRRCRRYIFVIKKIHFLSCLCCINPEVVRPRNWKINKTVFNLCEETISRTDEGQPRPKYIFNKCGTNIYFFTLQRFGASPSPNFKYKGIFIIPQHKYKRDGSVNLRIKCRLKYRQLSI